MTNRTPECIAVVLHLTHEDVEDQPRKGTAGSWSDTVEKVYAIARDRTHGDPADIQRIELQGTLGMPEEYRCYLEPGGDFVALYSIVASAAYAIVYREENTVFISTPTPLADLAEDLRRMRYWGDVLAIVPIRATDDIRKD